MPPKHSHVNRICNRKAFCGAVAITPSEVLIEMLSSLASRIRPSELGGGLSQLICRINPQAGTSKACHQGPSNQSPKTDATASQGSSGGSEAHVDLLLSDLLHMLASCSSSPPLTFLNFFEDHLNNTSPDHCKYNRTFCDLRTCTGTNMQTPPLQGDPGSHRTVILCWNTS